MIFYFYTFSFQNCFHVQSMIQYLVLASLLLCSYIFYAYYLQPKAEIKRYTAIFKNLGYSVYEQKFCFFGVSFVNDWVKGIENHKDALYTESTVYPHVDLVIGNIIEKIFIYFAHPDLIKEFVSGNVIHKYHKYSKLAEPLKLVFGEGGLVFSEGQDWKNKRKLMSKVFNFDLLTKNIPKIGAICDRAFEQFDTKFLIEGNKSQYDVSKVAAKITNGVMLICFFGSDQIKDEIKGIKYIDFLVKTVSQAATLGVTPLMVFIGKIAWKLGLTSQIRQCKENVRLMRQKSMEIIKKRTEEVMNAPKRQSCTDIIQALIYEKIDNNQQFFYSDHEVVDEFQTFLIAGTDTVTHFFTMMVYYLGKYPEIHKKLSDQVNSIIKSDHDITHENLKKLTYIDCVQNETIRHYGPEVRIFERIALQDHFIKDIPISKGTIASIHNRGTHYSEKYFKNPWEFRPERWESQCDNLNPYALGGFSFGSRSCIGKVLTMLESKIALVKLIRRYDSIEVPQEITKIITLMYEAQTYQTTFTKIPKQ